MWNESVFVVIRIYLNGILAEIGLEANLILIEIETFDLVEVEILDRSDGLMLRKSVINFS